MLFDRAIIRPAAPRLEVGPRVRRNTPENSAHAFEELMAKRLGHIVCSAAKRVDFVPLLPLTLLQGRNLLCVLVCTKSVARGAAACMAVRQDQVPRRAIRTPSSMVDIRASRSPSAHDYRCPFIWRMDFLGLAKVKGFMARIGPHHYGLAQCPDPVRLAEDGDYS